jgi:hypothetical protein
VKPPEFILDLLKLVGVIIFISSCRERPVIGKILLKRPPGLPGFFILYRQTSTSY